MTAAARAEGSRLALRVTGTRIQMRLHQRVRSGPVLAAAFGIGLLAGRHATRSRSAHRPRRAWAGRLATLLANTPFGVLGLLRG